MLEIETRNIHNVQGKLVCPNCNSAMREAERTNENGYTYIWFECIQKECYGQWLQKTKY